MERVVLDLPQEAHPWAASENLLLLDDTRCEPILSGLETEDAAGQLLVLSPDANSVYRLSPGQPMESQRIQIEVGSDLELDQVILWLDGSQFTSFDESPYRTWWPLEIGEHEIWAEGLTREGETIRSETIRFEVEPAEE